MSLSLNTKYNPAEAHLLMCMQMLQINISAIKQSKVLTPGWRRQAMHRKRMHALPAPPGPPRCIVCIFVRHRLCCPPGSEINSRVGRRAEVHACSSVRAAVAVNLSELRCSGLHAESTGFFTSMERQENRNGGPAPSCMHIIK